MSVTTRDTNRILWLPGEERMWDDEGTSRSAAGVRITSDNALQVTAVFACLRILGETVASLPLHLLERMAEGGKRQAREVPLYRLLHQQPNDWQTSFEWREQAVLHIGLWGDAYSEIKGAGTGTQLIPLHPSRMKVERIENGRLRYKYREDKGSETVYSQDQILHVRGPSDDGVHGISIVESCKDAIALARACELHGARFFGSGARPGFVLSTDGQLNAEAREQLRSQWDRRHGGVGNSHSTAVLTGGLKPYEVPLVNNTDAQFLDARAFQLAEVARLFRVPMHLLGVMNGGYGSIEHAGLDFVQHTILPWLRRFESAFMRDLIADDDRYQVEFDVRGLLRGDAASRSAYYRAMWDIGALSTNDILELENRNPVEGGDTRYRPLNMGTLGQEPSEADVLAQQQPGSGIDGQAVEGGLATAEEAAPEPQAETSLSTAEVASLLTIVKQITDGLLSIDAARAIIAAAFPVLSAARVETILQGVQAPAPEPVAEPVAPEVPAKPQAVVEQVSERAAPGSVVEGDFVSWDSSGGRARGRIDHVMDYGTLDVPGTDFKIDASEEDPAALITVYEEVNGGWRATETQVGHKVATLTKIDPLPEPPAVEENAYGKLKRKGRKRGS
jgi:HK97 family phage portal protein